MANTHQALLDCAIASDLAYLPKQEFEKSAAKEGLAAVKFHQQDNHVAIIGTRGPNTFLAFRGSVGWLDWGDNLRLLWTKGPWGSVHRGFAGAERCIMKKIPPAALDGPYLWLTGHSLGGALAMLAGAVLHFNGAKNLAGICTFGQPAVGDVRFTRQFRRLLGDRYFRFVNSMDAIPLAPTLAHHVGKPFYFDASGRLRRGAPFYRQLSDAVIEGSQRGVLPQVQAHTMSRYRNTLDSQAPRLRELLGAQKQPGHPRQ